MKFQYFLYLKKKIMKKNDKFIKYICPKYKTKEYIPTEVVQMLDEADCIGVDLSEPPKLNYEKFL